MIAKNTRTFIDNFLIKDKSKETLEVKNPKECWEWRNQAMDELQELEHLAKIGEATEKAYSNGAFLIYDVVENDDGAIERYNCDETIEELLGWLGFTESEENNE